jgi:hypothetical protein
MNRSGFLRAFGRVGLALSLSLGFAACEGEEIETGDELDVAETRSLFGDDRVADVLKNNLDRVPRNWAEFETLFKVGRECARQDTKEIFVVEESSSRASGHTEETEGLMPRAVITGCNTGDLQYEGEAQYQSFSLMAAIFSSPDVPGASKGDPMVFDRVEVMALDRKTGLYNFYLMTPSSDPKKAGILQRIQLRPDNQVYTYTKDPTKKKLSTKKSADRLCNNCHINMGPLLNELHEPWTNWISTHKKLPDTASKLSGQTWSMVNEAVSIDGKHNRLSLANDMEKTLVAGLRVWNEGTATSPQLGFVQATIDGDQPGGLKKLVASLFCETELQYASAFSTVPLELFVDPGAVAGGNFQPPATYATNAFPILMPVRSDMDKRIETSLIKKRILSQKTAIAIRLLDDRNDVFSSARCDLYGPATDGMPTDASKLDAHLRNFLRARTDSSYPPGVRRDYAKALLDDTASTEAVKTARTTYLTSMAAALKEDVTKLQSVAGRDQLKSRSQLRKDAARNLFKGDANPLPLLDDEELGL